MFTHIPSTLCGPSRVSSGIPFVPVYRRGVDRYLGMPQKTVPNTGIPIKKSMLFILWLRPEQKGKHCVGNARSCIINLHYGDIPFYSKLNL